MKHIQLLSFFILSLFLCTESIAQESSVTNPTDPKDSSETALLLAEEMPEFQGGNEAMMNFLSKNIQYPPEAKEKDISGRVLVQFIVEKDGQVSHIKIIKSPSDELSREAIRVVKMFPAWKPGKMKGQPVRVMYTLPIRFELQ